MTIALDGPLLLVGAGKMGGALLEGWLNRGLDPETVYALDPGPPPEVAALIERAGVRLQAEPPALAEAPAVIVLAVKPQIMDEAVTPLRGLPGGNTLVLSIAAGRTLASIERHFESGTAVVRSMPNTPASIGRGMTVACANAAVSSAQREICDALLGAVGEVAWLEDEAAMDVVTAVSGSGPAYVFLLAECMAEAGKEAGLDAELARQLARATVCGAGELMRQSDLDPATLRKNVTSPGGTTAAALDVLMGEDGLQRLMNRAVEAAAKRSRELSS